MTEGDLLVRTPGDRLDLGGRVVLARHSDRFWFVSLCYRLHAGPMELGLSPMLTTFTATDWECPWLRSSSLTRRGDFRTISGVVTRNIVGTGFATLCP